MIKYLVIGILFITILLCGCIDLRSECKPFHVVDKELVGFNTVNAGYPVVYDEKRGYAVTIQQYKSVIKDHTYMARTWNDDLVTLEWRVAFCEV